MNMNNIEVEREMNNKEPPAAKFNEIEEEINEIPYNCCDCPSFIEIISIDEITNNINFKCLKEAKKKQFQSKNI